MIVVRLMGGLGNQMFQYAAARRLALASGSSLVVDLGWFAHEARRYRTPREFELGRFGLRARWVTLPPRTVEAWERGEAARLGLRRRRLSVLRDEGAATRVDQRVLAAPDDVLLAGYWQSERYFMEVSDVIRADFSFRGTPPAPYAELLRVARAPTSVGVHVRRGDYVDDPVANAFHGTLDARYYREAVERIAERSGDIHVLLVSDDPEWAAGHLHFDHQVTNVSAAGGDAVDELRVLAACTHHVIANSSFSWWGAWLAEREGQIVVAPRRWFRDAAIDTSELLPLRWIRL